MGCGMPRAPGGVGCGLGSQEGGGASEGLQEGTTKHLFLQSSPVGGSASYSQVARPQYLTQEAYACAVGRGTLHGPSSMPWA